MWPCIQVQRFYSCGQKATEILECFFLFLQTKCSMKEKSLSKAVQSSGWNLFS